MRNSVYTAMLLSLGALWACSSGSGSGGTSSGSTSTSTSGAGGAGGSTNFTTSGSGGSSGAGGPDCASMPDHQTCLNCEATKHPTGSMLYKALNDCLYCAECYNDCNGKAKGCASPPVQKGMCDGNAPDPVACGDTNGGCVKCAYAGACKAAANACVGSQDCITYGAEILMCKP